MRNEQEIKDALGGLKMLRKKNYDMSKLLKKEGVPPFKWTKTTRSMAIDMLEWVLEETEN